MPGRLWKLAAVLLAAGSSGSVPTRSALATTVDLFADCRAAIEFAKDSAEILPAARAQLAHVGAGLSRSSPPVIMIKLGQRADEDSGSGIGERRARLLVDQLAQMGVPRERTVVVHESGQPWASALIVGCPELAPVYLHRHETAETRRVTVNQVGEFRLSIPVRYLEPVWWHAPDVEFVGRRLELTLTWPRMEPRSVLGPGACSSSGSCNTAIRVTVMSPGQLPVSLSDQVGEGVVRGDVVLFRRGPPSDDKGFESALPEGPAFSGSCAPHEPQARGTGTGFAPGGAR